MEVKHYQSNWPEVYVKGIPYMFILLANVLLTQIEKAIKDRRLQGLTLIRGWLELHHLFFVDDFLFFIQGTVENARTLRSIIVDYCRAIGQRINTSKYTLTFNKGAEVSMRLAIEEELCIASSNDPWKYLGLPSMWSRSERAALGCLKAQIQENLHGWRSKTLNQEIKEVLIKLVITIIPTYAMSVFCLPKSGCSEINSMIKDF